MQRRYALSLGCTALALVLVRGAVRGELIGELIAEAILMLVVFAIGGGIAGWIADHLLRQEIEARYRERVAWYREGLDRLASQRTKTDSPSQDGLAKPDSV